MRYIIGCVMLTAAFFTVMAGYASIPSASTCRLINSVQTQLGAHAACAAHPAAGYFIGAAVLAVGGLLCLAPLWGRWIAGKPAKAATTRRTER